MEREKFKNWLLKNNYSDNTSYSYSNSINKISEHLSENKGERIDLFTITNLPFLNEIVNLYGTKGNYSEFGYGGKGTIRNAIVAYYKYRSNNKSIESQTNLSIETEFESENDNISNNFSYERDLKNSMISNISELFPNYKIFGKNNEGIEYLIDGKRIDILLEKSNGSLLAVELKSGIANFKVFGQISMYLGLLMEKFPNKEIKGCIVAGEIDRTLKSATRTNDLVTLLTYTMKLELSKE